MQIIIRPFGSSRNFIDDGAILTFEMPLNAQELIKIIIEKWAKNDNEITILKQCALANEDAILKSDHVISSSCEISIFPPVSGG